MAHLQIDLDEQTLEQASTRAAQAKNAMDELVKLARRSKSSSEGRSWTREELCERSGN